MGNKWKRGDWNVRTFAGNSLRLFDMATMDIWHRGPIPPLCEEEAEAGPKPMSVRANITAGKGLTAPEFPKDYLLFTHQIDDQGLPVWGGHRCYYVADGVATRCICWDKLDIGTATMKARQNEIAADIKKSIMHAVIQEAEARAKQKEEPETKAEAKPEAKPEAQSETGFDVENVGAAISDQILDLRDLMAQLFEDGGSYEVADRIAALTNAMTGLIREASSAGLVPGGAA